MRLKLHDLTSRLLPAAALLAAGSVAAQDYPASVEPDTLKAWLAKSTNIAPDTVVSVTRELVVAVAGKTEPASAGGPVRLTLREEVIAPAYVDRVGGRSSLMSMEIHCEERRLRMDERRLYAGPNLTGSVQIADPSADWVRIPEGSILDEVAWAACGANFAWPLRAIGSGPAGPEVVPAAVNTPPAILPPGPDAKLVEDEPLPEEMTSATVVATTEPDANTVEPAIENAEAPVAPALAPDPDPDPAPVPVETVAVIASEAPTAPAPEADMAPEAVAASVRPMLPQPAFAVQIGAYETREAAEGAWARLSVERPVVTAGLSFEIRPVRVKGKDWLRGLVRSFPTKGDADAFCALIAGPGYGCILRPLRD